MELDLTRPETYDAFVAAVEKLIADIVAHGGDEAQVRETVRTWMVRYIWKESKEDGRRK